MFSENKIPIPSALGTVHREEPSQNPNKSAKKMFFFFMEIFTWLEPELKNR